MRKKWCIIVIVNFRGSDIMDFNIKDFGAVGDGRLDTEAIQRTIDAAAECGGRVIIEGGSYTSGTLWLRSRVELHIERGAALVSSRSSGDLPAIPGYKSADEMGMPMQSGRAFIIADGIEGAAITGGGKINLSGDAYYEPKTGEFEGWSYKRKNDDIPRFGTIVVGSRDFTFEGVTYENIPSACWTLWIHGSAVVNIRAIKIFAKLEVPHTDGIHINSSKDVHVSDCTIITGDDSLIVRANNSSLKENLACERVTVTNCTVTSYSGGIRVGWVRDGVIRNCSFENIVMTDTTCGIDIFIPADYPECSDHGRENTLVDNLTFSNIIMNEIYGKPIKIHIAESEETYCEAVRNLHFNGIRATSLEFPLILGKKSSPVENVTFSDCSFTVVDEKKFPGNKNFHGPAAWSATNHTAPDMVTNARGVTFSNTVFNKE